MSGTETQSETCFFLFTWITQIRQKTQKLKTQIRMIFLFAKLGINSPSLVAPHDLS